MMIKRPAAILSTLICLEARRFLLLFIIFITQLINGKTVCFRIETDRIANETDLSQSEWSIDSDSSIVPWFDDDKAAKKSRCN